MRSALKKIGLFIALSALKNDLFIDRTARLQPNTIDLDYLEEQLRLKTGYIAENEILITVEE